MKYLSKIAVIPITDLMRVKIQHNDEIKTSVENNYRYIFAGPVSYSDTSAH